MFINLSVLLFVFLSVRQSACLFGYLSAACVCLSICLSVFVMRLMMTVPKLLYFSFSFYMVMSLQFSLFEFFSLCVHVNLAKQIWIYDDESNNHSCLIVLHNKHFYLTFQNIFYYQTLSNILNFVSVSWFNRQHIGLRTERFWDQIPGGYCKWYFTGYSSIL